MSSAPITQAALESLTGEALRLAEVARSRRTLRLTPRWMEPGGKGLRHHPTQALYFWHPARFKINPSGRRSGKTELAKRRGVLKLLQKNRSGRPRKIFFSAPSFGQAHDIFWKDLNDLIPEYWVAKKLEYPRMEITTKWGSMLRVFGFDRPRRIEGVPWSDGFIDEIADCPRGCFALNVRPALATIGIEGNCDLLGVPDEVGRNQAEYEKLYEDGLGWSPDPALAKDPEVCSFHWRAEDILSAGEIAGLRRGLDEFAYEQEMGGRFVKSGAKAIPRFDPKFHVSAAHAQYDPRLPTDWLLDFGYDPAVTLIAQTYRGYMWVVDEIDLKESSTEAMATAFFERCAKAGYSLRRLRIFGDAAGKTHHSNTGITDYEILEQRLRRLPDVQWLQNEVNPPVKDTVNAVRAKACSKSGEVRLHIHPRCARLIEDCKTAPWPDDLRKYHALASLRYYAYVFWEYGGSSSYSVAPQ